MVFSSEKVNEIFTKYNYSDFSALMYETGMKSPRVDVKQANDKIREIFRSVIGVNEKASRKELRKAIRRHKTEIFEITEEVLENLVSTGWQDNPFFKEFVEYRSLSDGDTNEFYVEDNVILTVSKLSGNHHDLNSYRIRIA